MREREDILLRTKISVPAARDQHVVRSRLVGRLAASAAGRLSIVCAPAGFGKTTLLGQWARTSGRAVAWLSLDERDNDGRRFWRYVLFTLEAALNVDWKARLLPLLAAHSKHAILTFIDALLNEMADCGEPVSLVLDDYHGISDEAIHAGLAHFIEYLPSAAHVCIASRTEPAISALSRWNARGELCEIVSTELLFTEEDAAAWYGKSLGRALPPEWIRTAVERTEGWAAGLQLAAIAWQAGDDAGAGGLRRWGAFTGRHRRVTDYLLAEVLSGVPDDLRDFMLRTSVLQRMNAALCDELTGRADSRSILESMKQRQLFLVPLEPTETWFRYHHLFADGLRALLRKESEAEWERLNGAASRWHAERGDGEEAIWHALASRDYGWAADCLNRGLAETLGKGEFGTLLRWFGQFPPDWPLPHRLALVHAFLLAVTERFEAADGLLRRLQLLLEELPEGDERGELAAGLFFVKANLAFSSRDYEQWFAYAATIQERLPEDPVFFHLNYNPNEPFVRHTAFGLKGIINEETVLVGRRIVAILDTHGWQHSLFCKYIMQAMAEGFYEMDEFAECRQLLQRIEQGGELARTPGLFVPQRLTLARLEWAEGRRERARAVVEEAAARMERQADGRWLRALRAFAARLDIAAGALDSAERTLAELPVVPEQRPSSDRMLEFVTLARQLLARGDAVKACALLERLRALAEAEEWIHVTAEIAVVQALARWQSGDRAQAFGNLDEALRLGEPNGYARTMLDEGAALSEVLAAYVRQANPAAEAYARRLLERMPEAERTLASRGGHRLIEPLTPKELEILELVREGRSNRQIAERLKLTLGTVKVYTNRIYGKLGVTSRVQAVLKMQRIAERDRG